MLLVEVSTSFVSFEHEYLVSFCDTSIEQKIINLSLSWNFFQLIHFSLGCVLSSRVVVAHKYDVSSLMIQARCFVFVSVKYTTFFEKFSTLGVEDSNACFKDDNDINFMH